MSVQFNLSSSRAYRASALKVVQGMLADWSRQNSKPLASLTVADVQRNLRAIQRYPGMEQLRLSPREEEIVTVSTTSQSETQLTAARQAYLGGTVFIEDMAAGDGTRLRLGNKYTLTPKDLQHGLAVENEARTRAMAGGATTLTARVESGQLSPLTIGTRHKLQFAFDLTNLAVQAGLNPREVLKSQFVLTVLNEKIFNEVIREIIKYNYFGFHPDRMLFMVQNLYPGMEVENGQARFSSTAPFKLWNHGDVVMTETLDRQIFRVRFNRFGEIERVPLSADEFEAVLAAQAVKLSYPIEDLDYLTGSTGLSSVGLALDFGAQGFDMVMEMSGQKPNDEFDGSFLSSFSVSAEEIARARSEGLLEQNGDLSRFKPGRIPEWASPDLRMAWLRTIRAQKGGVWAFDNVNEGMNRPVVLETDITGEVIDPSDEKKDTRTLITALNRNFNMFPDPVRIWRRLREQGLRPHLDVSDGFVYLASPQGDQSFLGRTVMIRREPLQPIRSLKEPADIPGTLEAMAAQDAQSGFRDFAQSHGALPSPDGRVIYSRVFVPLLDRLADRAVGSSTPLPIETLSDEVYLSSLNGRGQDHLRAALELCETVGSEIFSFKIRPGGDEVFEPIPDTLKGEKAPGLSPKFPKSASEIHVGLKDGQVYISILNFQSHNEGETVVLYVKFKDDVPAERIKQLLGNKFAVIKEHLPDDSASDEAVWQTLLSLPLAQLFALRATKLASIVESRLQVA